MTREEAIDHIKDVICENNTIKPNMVVFEQEKEALCMAIKALEQEPCDAVSRADTLQSFESYCENNCQYSKKQRDVMCGACMMGDAIEIVENLPLVTPKQKLCKDCKFFEYDHMENVDGIPLIVAHEICNKWGDGCKTKEDGYCFLFEPKMEGESE